MSDPDRRTAPVVELIPTVDSQPTPGMRMAAALWRLCGIAKAAKSLMHGCHTQRPRQQ